VISGGTTGIGLACAKRLLNDGCRVAIFSQNTRHVTEAVKVLSAEFGPDAVFGDMVDLQFPEQIATFFSRVKDHWAAPQILVCNAGYSPKRPDGRVPFQELSLEEWNDVLNINLTGAMLCCQAASQGMIDAGFGRIVLIGSVAGRTLPRIAGARYVASKAGLVGLARALVSELSCHGRTVNTIAPGRILTGMTGPEDSAANKSALERIPVGRLGHPEDIAEAVAFLTSKKSGFVNGAIIDVNGGEFVPA